MISIEGPSRARCQLGWKEFTHTPLKLTREYHQDQVMSLLERFVANPALDLHEVRMKLGVLDEVTAEVFFALTVFLCDCLLQLKPAADATTSPRAQSC